MFRAYCVKSRSWFRIGVRFRVGVEVRDGVKVGVKVGVKAVVGLGLGCL